MKNQLFQEINRVDDQLSALSKKRQQDADRHYKMGFQILNTGYSQGFKDLSMLEKACGEFIQAMRYNRTDLRPYLALSYLFSLVNNFSMAWKYLNAAKRISENNEVVDNWEGQLRTQQEKHDEQRRNQAKDASSLKLMQLVGDEDLEALTPEMVEEMAEKLMDFLKSQSQQILKQAPPKPNPHPQALQKLNIALLNFQKTMDIIQQQIKILSGYHDTQPFEALAKPLEAHLKRFKDTIGVSMTLYELLENCQEEEQRLIALADQIKQLADPDEMLEVQETMEDILDACDALADQLDYLDEQGYSIELIEPVYKQLTTEVIACQDLLDKTVALFNQAQRQRDGNLPPRPSTTGIKPLLQSLSPEHLAVLARRLWFLLPLPPYAKAASALQTFCLHPNRAKLQWVIKELMDSLALTQEPQKEAEVYALLAKLFYSYSKPLLALDFVAYAQYLVPDLAHIDRLNELLDIFSRQRLKANEAPKKPKLDKINRIVQNTTMPIEQVASSLQVLLPEQLHHRASALYREALELLCDFCMQPAMNTLINACDRLLMAQAQGEHAGEVYVLLGAILLGLGKLMPAEEFIAYAQALEPGLEAANYVNTRATHLKTPQSNQTAKSPPVANRQIRKPSGEVAAKTLENPAVGMKKVAENLTALLPLADAFPENYSPLQQLQMFTQSHDSALWQQAVAGLNQALSSPQARGEDFALMGLLLYACGKPLLLFEYLGHALQIAPESAMVKTMQARFRPQK